MLSTCRAVIIMLWLAFLCLARGTVIGTPYRVRSLLAQQIEAVQSNCQLQNTPHMMPGYGLGSDLHTWGQVLCQSIERGHRLQVHGPWLWTDKRNCPNTNANVLACYFPLEEALCTENSTGIGRLDKLGDCPSFWTDVVNKTLYRTAATEYLFSRGLRHFVRDEIASQLRDVFKADRVPSKMITVHMRWGDKAGEMTLVAAQEYVDAVQTLVTTKRQPNTPVHVYVSTEDPKAYAAFLDAAPPQWHIYADAMLTRMQSYRPNSGNHAKISAIQSNGEAGTVALASLAIAMEATDYVLTTGSNWSRLMDELRRGVLDPRCKKCTTMVDLRPLSPDSKF